jgi:hypothetical protein
MTVKVPVMVALVQLHGLPTHAAERKLHDNINLKSSSRAYAWQLPF